MSDFLKSAIAEIGIVISQNQLMMLEDMLDCLNDWNQKHNLTRLTKRRDQEIYHVLDSLSAYQYFEACHSILDVGTGAGFPGIPLAIIYPNKLFSLVESNGKKIAYLRHVILKLGLKNIKLYHSRIEQIRIEQFPTEKGPVDVITARALANPEAIIAWTKHLGISKYALYVGPNCPAPSNGHISAISVPHSTKSHFILSVEG